MNFKGILSGNGIFEGFFRDLRDFWAIWRDFWRVLPKFSRIFKGLCQEMDFGGIFKGFSKGFSGFFKNF